MKSESKLDKHSNYVHTYLPRLITNNSAFTSLTSSTNSTQLRKALLFVMFVKTVVFSNKVTYCAFFSITAIFLIDRCEATPTHVLCSLDIVVVSSMHHSQTILIEDASEGLGRIEVNLQFEAT